MMTLQLVQKCGCVMIQEPELVNVWMHLIVLPQLLMYGCMTSVNTTTSISMRKDVDITKIALTLVMICLNGMKNIIIVKVMTILAGTIQVKVIIGLIIVAFIPVQLVILRYLKMEFNQ